MNRMQYFLSSYVFLILCISVPLFSWAQVYKWTDENGKVHFSDTKPEDNQADSLDLKTPGLPPAKIIASPKPIPHTDSEPSLWILYRDPELAFATQGGSRNNITFYFGEDCVQPLPVSWKDLTLRYKEQLPNWQYQATRSSKVFGEFGYRKKAATHQSIRSHKNKNDARLLDIQIIDLKLHACAPNLVHKVRKRQKSVKYAQDLEQFSIGSFSKVQAWVKVQWQLSDMDGAIIYSGISEGVSSEKLREYGNSNKALIEAFELSFRNILGDRAFASKLVAHKKEPVKVSAPLKKQKMPKTEPSTMDKIYNVVSGKYMSRSKFAEALSYVTPIKMEVTSYFYETGRWPKNFSELGLESHLFTKYGLIDSVEVIHDGTIDVDISPAFGEKARIWLQPEDNGVRIDWTCTTNIDKGKVPAACH